MVSAQGGAEITGINSEGSVRGVEGDIKGKGGGEVLFPLLLRTSWLCSKV